MPLRLRVFSHCLLLTFALIPRSGTAVPLRAQLDAIFAPLRVQSSALAPDGRHVAFAVNTGHALELQIFTVDQPAAPVKVPIENDPRGSTQFISWVSSDCVVVSTRSTLVTSNASGGALRRFNPATLPPEWLFREPRAPQPTFRVVGIAAEPDSVVLELTEPYQLNPEEPPDFSRSNVTVSRLNLRTWETKTLLKKLVSLPGGSTLADTTGQPRIFFDRGSSPRRFEYQPAEAVGTSWQPLDRVLTDRETFTSDVTPANLLGHRSIPLGFGSDPNLLYFASNLHRDTYGIYQADLRTGKRTAIILEKDVVDLANLEMPWLSSPLVFDRRTQALAGVKIAGMETYTHWIDPEIATVQAELDRKFTGRTVTLIEWDDARRHVLFTTSSSTDPGRSFLLDRNDGRCTEYLRHAQLAPEDANFSTWFAFDTPSGTRLTGYITLPHAAPVKKPGLVVWFHDGPLERLTPGFQREAQALAALGLAVVQINYRGSIGFGVRHGEALPDRVDREPADDAVAAIGELAKRYSLDDRRVAAMGEGRGGYLALRAMQLHPEAFRAGVAINADLDPALPVMNQGYKFDALAGARKAAERIQGGTNEGTPMTSTIDFDVIEPTEFEQSLGARSEPTKVYSLESGAAFRFSREFARLATASTERRKIAVTAYPEMLTQPVFLLHDPASLSAPISPVRALRETLKRRKTAPDYFELSPLYARGDPAIRANVFTRIARFINGSFYDFEVKIGETVEKK